MSERLPQSAEASQDFYERSQQLLDARHTQAEVAVMLGDDAEAAQALKGYLQTQFDIEGRSVGGDRITDDEREDSSETLARKMATIDSLTMQPNGDLSPLGTETLDHFRLMTREAIADVAIKGDTAGYDQAAIDKYNKLARDYLKRPPTEA